MDVEKVADSVFKAVESRIEKAIAPLLERLLILEAREFPTVSSLKEQIWNPEEMRSMFAMEAKALIDANPPKDGKDAEPIVVSEVVAELLTTDGLKSLVDLQAAESVAAYFTEHPVVHGKDAEPVSEEQLAQQVSKYMADNPVVGEKGEPGTGLADAMIDRTGNLVLTMTDGRMKELGLVVGKDGNPGKDGADGFGFDDLTVSFDGEGIVHEYKRGEKAITQRFPLNVMKHIGFWRAGMEAKSGNVTTHNGCSWLCLKDTSESPSYEAKDWILSARKGRDGLDAKDAKPPEPVKLHGN